jgi:hypothetical protein
MEFEQFEPYYLNYDLLENIKLRPRSENSSITEEISLQDLFNKIRRNEDKFSYEYEFDSPYINFTIGNEYYSFLRSDAPDVLTTILEAAEETKDLPSVLNARWLYIEEADIPDYPWFDFFLCKFDSDQIINPSFSVPMAFSDSSDFLNFLMKDDAYSDYKAALMRLCYEKWQKETLPGRIYAMKKKMEDEEYEKFKNKEGGAQPDSNTSFLLKEISLLREDVKSIASAIKIIIGLLAFYIVWQLLK